MAAKETLYDSIHQLREVDGKSVQRIMLTGYFNEEDVKHHSINTEQFVNPHLCRLGTPSNPSPTSNPIST
jgi:hypothetical protein